MRYIGESMNVTYRTFGFIAVAVAMRAATPAPETLLIPGLSQPVEIIKDHWGVSHIYAKNEADLFFAQGYNVARDRLFQLEMWRRQATGTVAEILGKKELKRDIGDRLFQFRGDLGNELNWYHPRSAAIIEAFVKGINAYIGETEKNLALLTPEFKMLGIRPGKWTPAVVLSRFNALLGNIDEELGTALAIKTIGVDKVKDIEYFQPADPNLEIDPVIDTSLLSDQLLDLYHAFRTPLKFTADEVLPEYRNPKPVADLGLGFDPAKYNGSNNWVVSGKLAATGYPLMMNDPHRDLEAPSLRYWVHLVAPGWNVIGGGEPALPGVSIGHNDFAAWGLTIFGTDSEDLYVYDTNPANPSQYKYSGAWESMKIIRESIPVKGAAPVSVELKYTATAPWFSRTSLITRPTRCARRGAKWEARPIWPACAWINRIAGRNFWMRAATAASRPKTWFGRTGTATSDTRPLESPRGVRTGAAWSRCPATAATNGTAFCPSKNCRTC